MSVREAATQQFLVEWYQPALPDAPPQKIAARLEAGITAVSADGTRVRLELSNERRALQGLPSPGEIPARSWSRASAPSA